MNSDSPDKVTPGRLGNIVMAVAIGLALTGYFSGLAGTEDRQPRAGPAASQAAATASPNHPGHAVSYLEMGQSDLKPNSRFRSSVTQIVGAPADLLAPVVQDATQKAQALSQRSERRAYSGAPPVIPHPIDQRSAAGCLACHASGMKIGARIAPPLSHPQMTVCFQCHVESTNRVLQPQGPKLLIENVFAGLASPEAGTRAWPGAPPTIPHATFMRENCAGCHGVFGKPGMRTTHPWRNNCLQCHAANFQFDQRTFQGIAEPRFAPAESELHER